MRHKSLILLSLILCLLLCGCGGEEAALTDKPPLSPKNWTPETPAVTANADGAESYTAPDFLSSAFHGEFAEVSGGVSIDLSATADGYVAVSVVSDKRLKFQVIKDEATYNYDIASDGTPSILPLQCGDGVYRFRVMENVVDNRYAEIYSTSRDVVLSDEFQPFLRPNDYVNYSKDSDCVKKAQELADSSSDALTLVGSVYDYICTGVVYDYDKAASVKSGYLPTPDETMKSGKGICFDYASLAASMLRSQGIPTKLVLGYVSPNGNYHAWNMFYTKETGWVTVKFEVSGKSWVRLDLTFAASGADPDFIGDGSNYSDLYYY